MKTRPTSHKLPYLKAWRMHRMLKGIELAHTVGVTSTTISALEKCKKTTRQETIEKLAAALAITPEQLLTSWPHGMKPPTATDHE